MDTKSKSWATSRVIKVILFAIFLTATWFALFFAVALVDAGMNKDIPFASMESPNPEDDYLFHRFEEDLTEILVFKGDVTDIDNYRLMPTVYYRAQYPDGSVMTNVPDTDYKQQGDDFFRSRKVFAIMTTTPDGGWQSSDKDISYRRRSSHLSPISRYDITSVMSYGSTSVVSYTNALGLTTTTTVTDTSNMTAEDNAAEADEDQYNPNGWSEKEPCPIVRIAYAFDDASLATMADYYTQCRSYILSSLSVICSLALAALLSAIWLLVTCGRRRGSSELHTLSIDRIPAELQLLVFFGLDVGFVLLCVWWTAQLTYTSFYGDPYFYTAVISGATVVAWLLLLWCMSVMRSIKARCFIRNSITFRLCRWCWRPFAKLWDMVRSCFDERSFRDSPLTVALMRRQLVFLGALGAVLLLTLFVGLASYAEAGFVVVFIMLCLGLAAVAYWHISGNRKTYEQINQGMSDSVADQIKSERTKTALITNVSHDLKTPLTSIITYVDLLSQEELSDTARDYVTVLEQKSERLKSMVSDLFDLAKSSSGNLPMELETLDLHRLLEQTLADMRDSIDASGLTIKTSFPDGEVDIYSDGKKLYRVFQNIIGNALKYSLAGTRIYVSLELEGERAVAIVRNTAGYEMDFTADEVLQRFVRGDKSRSGEGSGLGLSIADSFTTACGGEFTLSIDGDLFKVTTSFPVTTASRSAVPNNA